MSTESLNLLDLVRELDAHGEKSAASLLLEKAADRGDETKVKVFVPPVYTSPRQVSSHRGASHQGVSPGGSRLVDRHGHTLPSPHTSALQKALSRHSASDANAPQPTQIRLSQALSTIGAYDGIIDPAAMTNATFYILKLAARLPLVQAIINTRVNQATKTRWRIRLRDKKAAVTPAARRLIAETTDFVNDGGFKYEPARGKKRGPLRRHPITGEPGVWDGLGYERALSFRDSVACLARDSLSMGWACLRSEPGEDEERYPVAFYRPVASELIRRVLPPRDGLPSYSSKFDPPTPNVAYIELDPMSLGKTSAGEPLREFPWDRIQTVERYPRVDSLGLSYPYCEVEICLELLASRLNAHRFLSENYDNNHIPLGILSIIGATLGEESFYELQAQLAKGGGMDAFYRILYLHFMDPGAGVNFTPLKSQTGLAAELQWALQYKADIRDEILAVFQMNPEELGQRAFDNNNGPKLNQNGPDANISHSKSKGYEPLMRAIETPFDNMVSRFDPDLMFEFENIDGSNAEEDARVATAMLGIGRTLNEVRDERDEPRFFRPVEPVLWSTIERDLRRELQQRDGPDWEDNFASQDEIREMVDALYEAQLKKEGVPCIWSSAWDSPVGTAAMAAQIFQGEQSQNQAFRQQVQQQQMQAQQQMQQQQMQAQHASPEQQMPQEQGQQEPQAQEQADSEPEPGAQEATGQEPAPAPDEPSQEAPEPGAPDASGAQSPEMSQMFGFPTRARERN